MGAQTFRCPGCGSTYNLPSILMEKGDLHVRCPSCKRSYHLRWRPGADTLAPSPAIAAQAEPRPGAAPAPPAAVPPPLSPAAPVAPPLQAGELAPAPAGSAQQEARRARRFARALAESILQGPGRRERRDRALAEGRLLQEFSAELGAAWRLYVDKVGEDCARTSPYFRDAFNEILADGRQLF